MFNPKLLRGLSSLALAVGVLIFPACESDDNAHDNDAYFQSNPHTSTQRGQPNPELLIITPTSATITNVGISVVFRGEGGVGPYVWEVANANGNLRVNGWSQAIYTSVAVGQNSVIVHDQQGHHAVATIDATVPPPSPLTAGANPNLLSANGDTSTLNASGGAPPYTWRVVDTTRGRLLGPATGNSVVYQRSLSGDNVVTVTDSSGNTYNVRIEQP